MFEEGRDAVKDAGYALYDKPFQEYLQRSKVKTGTDSTICKRSFKNLISAFNNMAKENESLSAFNTVEVFKGFYNSIAQDDDKNVQIPQDKQAKIKEFFPQGTCKATINKK